MNIPPSVREGVERALESSVGRTMRIRSATPVGGGCINPSAKVTVETGESFFVKWNPSAEANMFMAEADGLRALAKPGALRIPAVLGEGSPGSSAEPGWLLLEFIPQGHPAPDYGKRLGEGLAKLHSFGTPEAQPPGSFGWHRHNFIGSLDQSNDPREDWPSFWRELRLEPQVRLARDRGHFQGSAGKVMNDLLDGLDRIMADSGHRGPELLHGDLWSGNYYPGPDGEPVLIDPAVYLGVGEVDLAMMELFGSPPRGFLEAYGKQRGLNPVYDIIYRDLYQLYYLLVHVNLFGGSYVAGSLRAAERVLRES